MLIVDAPTQTPGACFVTGRSQGRMIDTLVDIDSRPPLGRIYLAEDLVLDLAQRFGYVGPVAAARAQERIEALERDLDVARGTIREQAQAVTALSAQTKAPAGSVAVGDCVPVGSIRAVLGWVNEAEGLQRIARAGTALEVELREERPRDGLLTGLYSVLEDTSVEKAKAQTEETVS